MEHIVLLGDSILDNQAYVSGPDVVAQVRQLLPAGWVATLCARDGSVAYNVLAQIKHIPPGATFLILSVGGNNALQELLTFDEPTSMYSQGLIKLAFNLEQFEQEYRQTIEHLLKRDVPLAVCTIYYPQFPEARIQKAAKSVLAGYNDVIFRVALEYRLPVIDLRAICDRKEDFANPIEPSLVGGAKIARAIFQTVNRFHRERWFVAPFGLHT